MLHLMMRTLAPPLLVALSLSGCAHRPTTSEHLRAAEIALKGAHVRADQDSRWWEDAVDRQIRRCAQLQTSEARRQCMGVFAEGADLEDEAEALAQAYDAIAEQLLEAKRAAAALQELYNEAGAQLEKERTDG